jgi:hypothetical protein
MEKFADLDSTMLTRHAVAYRQEHNHWLDIFIHMLVVPRSKSNLPCVPAKDQLDKLTAMYPEAQSKTTLKKTVAATVF